MDQVNTLRRYGLFDAKVPRYTSYPPANRFQPGVGAEVQRDWLAATPTAQPVSLYVHIPFCRRLCWFCACRTQGTQTLNPIVSYLTVLMDEIETIATRDLPSEIKMGRLHLGGGTPTLLSSDLMTQLLTCISEQFAASDDFEFSVEIDPTEAAPEVLRTLAFWNMTRASVGVQDFDPRVQQAIGREQSFETTRDVIKTLRINGVQSLNIDLLYGLPHQTTASLIKTLDRIIALQPDRLALYGYAHVPHMSKRQVMIPTEALPDPEHRFAMSELAKERLVAVGYVPIGIDHFALPHDSLTKAAKSGQMTRNFQGYTDDPCRTLIGFGASAISRFPQGFLQNAVSTSAYSQRIHAHGHAAHKGYALSADDLFVGTLIDAMMCDGVIRLDEIRNRFPDRAKSLARIVTDLGITFPELLTFDDNRIAIKPALSAAARLIAAHLDKALQKNHQHSLAI